MTMTDDTRATAGEDDQIVASSPEHAEATDELNVDEPRAADDGGSGTLDESVIAAFEQELADARRLADENYDKYLRAEADLDTLRRRGRRQTDEAVRHLRRELLTRFLDIADNLELALSHADADPASVVTGIEGTYRYLTRLFDTEGVAPIDALDTRFDHNLHEAIGVVPMPGAAEELVVSVERTGYTLDGDTLRPARVIVGKPDDVETTSDGNAD